jgi:hypothetical protein
MKIRNISVDSSQRGRHIGPFTLRYAEQRAQEVFPGVTRAMADTKATNGQMIDFLLDEGYGMAAVTQLYDLDRPADVVLVKDFDELAR